MFDILELWWLVFLGGKKRRRFWLVVVVLGFIWGKFLYHPSVQPIIKAPDNSAEIAQFNGAPADRPLGSQPIEPAATTADHARWMDQAGIAKSDQGYANYIISNESGWRVTIYNTGGSGAYGLGQSLPGCKMMVLGPVKVSGPAGHQTCVALGGTPNPGWETDPIAQLKWCNWYAHASYGSWKNAQAFWAANSWW